MPTGPDAQLPVKGGSIVHPTKLALLGKVSVIVTSTAAPGVTVAFEVLLKVSA